MSPGLRWLSVVFACATSLALLSCDLNPQPEVPGIDETSAGGFQGVGGENGFGGEGGAAGGDLKTGDQAERSDDDVPGPADPGFNDKNTGNYEGPRPDEPRPDPPPPGGQRPVADAGTDGPPPIVAM